MIPQLLILAILLIWGVTAYRVRMQSRENYIQFRVVIGFILLIIGILHWGNFFAPLAKLL